MQYVVCQCPERGDPHFYRVTNYQRQGTPVCVNALKGATLISTRWKRLLLGDGEECVNALKGATLISTYIQNGKLTEMGQSVNALKGATLISTGAKAVEENVDDNVSMP